MKLDSVATVQTPEGVDLYLKLAGIWPRSVAWLIDSLIRGVIYLLLAISGGAIGDFGIGLFLIGVFLIEWFYPVLFEVFNHGMTPGKKALGIQVLNSDGTPIGWSASMLRNILRTVDFLPFFYGLGFVSMLLNDKFQRLGDLSADTIVSYINNTAIKTEIPYVKPAFTYFPLQLAEQQAIIRFAERSEDLSEERLNELAHILDSLDSDENDINRDKLLAIANSLIGRI